MQRAAWKARHIDDRIPGEVARLRSIKKAAVERAVQIPYWQCLDCHYDFRIHNRARIPDNYICKPCQTKRRNREVVHKCRICCEDFSVDRLYLGFDLKAPICDECQDVLDSGERDEDEEDPVCLMCGKDVEPFEPVCKACYNDCWERTNGSNRVEL
jgi:hypothetical protein